MVLGVLTSFGRPLGGTCWSCYPMLLLSTASSATCTVGTGQFHWGHADEYWEGGGWLVTLSSCVSYAGLCISVSYIPNPCCIDIIQNRGLGVVKDGLPVWIKNNPGQTRRKERHTSYCFGEFLARVPSEISHPTWQHPCTQDLWPQPPQRDYPSPL